MFVLILFIEVYSWARLFRFFCFQEVLGNYVQYLHFR